MIKENFSFLTCAGCIETRECSFYKSPFAFSESDKIIISDNNLRDGVFKALNNISMPLFIIEHEPLNARNQVAGFARMDSYILKLALLVYSIRLKINVEGDSERFLWTASEEAFEFLSNLDHDDVIECLIKREIYIKPVCDLSEVLKGNWEPSASESNRLMSHYLQIRFKQWRAA